MAGAVAGPATVSVEEYLADPRYELAEYLDGVVREKYPIVGGVPLVSNAHGFLVALILNWFSEHIDEWGVWPGTEAHTRVGPGRYRLPDISVLPLGPLETMQTAAPMIVIEVLSPSNTMGEMLRKLKDYERLGVPHVWVIDPEARVGWVCRGILMTETTRFVVEGTGIYLELEGVFGRFDRYQGVGER